MWKAEAAVARRDSAKAARSAFAFSTVIPAQAGIQRECAPKALLYKVRLRRGLLNWIPAFAGMTTVEGETGVGGCPQWKVRLRRGLSGWIPAEACPREGGGGNDDGKTRR